jgi:hypothetical protein
MRHLVLSFGMVVALGGCMDGAAPVSGGSTGAEARKLSAGMTPAQADAVFGVDAGYERNPANWDESCVSYAYGSPEAPRYVHAAFRNDRMVRATDGHGAICTYGDVL